MKLRVYVAAPFERRGQVRAIHDELARFGCEPTSSWADVPGTGPERFVPREKARQIAAENDRAVLSSHLLFVLASETGGEHLCEARFAAAHGIPVLWTGRSVLTAHRNGVARINSLAEGLECIVALQHFVPYAAGDEAALRRRILHFIAEAERPASGVDFSREAESSTRLLAATNLRQTPEASIPSNDDDDESEGVA